MGCPVGIRYYARVSVQSSEGCYIYGMPEVSVHYSNGRFCPHIQCVKLCNKIEVRAIVGIGALLKGKYCLLKTIGKGGEGIIYLARDVSLSKLWCVKIAAISDGQRILCRLESERIPQVVDYWEEDGRSFLVMEYISGCSLGELLKKKDIPRDMKIRWSRQLLLAIRYLHQQRPPIVHGDIKPENLLISRDGGLYLIDFGSAAPADESHGKMRKGTKGFAAPEQMQGCCTVQSDIYGVGKVLQQLWLGPGLGNRRLSQVLQKAQRKNPRDRYTDCESLQEDLERAFRAWKKENSQGLLLSVSAAIGVMLLAGISLGQRQGMIQDYSSDSSLGSQLEESDSGKVTLEQVHNAAIEVFRQTKDSENLAEYFQEAKQMGEVLLLQAENKQESHVLLLLAQICEAGGKKAAAESFYQLWMKKNPRESEGRVLYGLMLFRQGQKEDSLRLYQECVDLFDGKENHNYRIWGDKIKEWEV